MKILKTIAKVLIIVVISIFSLYISFVTFIVVGGLLVPEITKVKSPSKEQIEKVERKISKDINQPVKCYKTWLEEENSSTIGEHLFVPASQYTSTHYKLRAEDGIEFEYVDGTDEDGVGPHHTYYDIYNGIKVNEKITNIVSKYISIDDFAVITFGYLPKILINQELNIDKNTVESIFNDMMDDDNIVNYNNIYYIEEDNNTINDTIKKIEVKTYDGRNEVIDYSYSNEYNRLGDLYCPENEQCKIRMREEED